MEPAVVPRHHGFFTPTALTHSSMPPSPSFSRRDFLRLSGLAASTTLLAGCASSLGPITTRRKDLNVLLILVDDLRPELGCYGARHIHSPHIDALAASSTRFTRAYTQVAVCAPSRIALMSGLRPDTTNCHDLPDRMRDGVPNTVTLPQCFRENGYTSEEFGKTYHLGHGNVDDPLSWSIRNKAEPKPWYADPANLADHQARIAKGLNTQQAIARGFHRFSYPYEMLDVGDEAYSDGLNTTHAIERLRAYGGSQDPFFLTVGYLKPHLPFNAPKRYWDLYDLDRIVLPHQQDWPAGAPSYAGSNWEELRIYNGMPLHGPVDEETARKLIHGYYACISYTDAQIGRLLASLEANGLAENTAVVLWGDHGFKLDDYGAWCKHTNYEIDTRVPLLVRAPGLPGGRVCNSLCETVDIYPTLAELANVPVTKRLEGRSLVPCLENSSASVKDYALSQFPRYEPENLMGYTLRTDRYRITRWESLSDNRERSLEVYDHVTDPTETCNIAAPGAVTTAETRRTVTELNQLLTKTWRSAHRGSTPIGEARPAEPLS